jgi:hypothetical protein
LKDHPHPKDQPNLVGRQLFELFRISFPEFRPNVTNWWPAWGHFADWDAKTAWAIESKQFAENLKVKLNKMIEVTKQISTDKI